MIKKIKNLLVLAILFVISFALIGCKKKPASPNNDATDDNVEVTAKHNVELINVTIDGVQKDANNKAQLENKEYTFSFDRSDKQKLENVKVNGILSNPAIIEEGTSKTFKLTVKEDTVKVEAIIVSNITTFKIVVPKEVKLERPSNLNLDEVPEGTILLFTINLNTNEVVSKFSINDVEKNVEILELGFFTITANSDMNIKLEKTNQNIYQAQVYFDNRDENLTAVLSSFAIGDKQNFFPSVKVISQTNYDAATTEQQTIKDEFAACIADGTYNDMVGGIPKYEVIANKLNDLITDLYSSKVETGTKDGAFLYAASPALKPSMIIFEDGYALNKYVEKNTTIKFKLNDQKFPEFKKLDKVEISGSVITKTGEFYQVTLDSSKTLNLVFVYDATIGVTITKPDYVTVTPATPSLGDNVQIDLTVPSGQEGIKITINGGTMPISTPFPYEIDNKNVNIEVITKETGYKQSAFDLMVQLQTFLGYANTQHIAAADGTDVHTNNKFCTQENLDKYNALKQKISAKNWENSLYRIDFFLDALISDGSTKLTIDELNQELSNFNSSYSTNFKPGLRTKPKLTLASDELKKYVENDSLFGVLYNSGDEVTVEFKDFPQDKAFLISINNVIIDESMLLSIDSIKIQMSTDKVLNITFIEKEIKFNVLSGFALFTEAQEMDPVVSEDGFDVSKDEFWVTEQESPLMEEKFESTMAFLSHMSNPENVTLANSQTLLQMATDLNQFLKLHAKPGLQD